MRTIRRIPRKQYQSPRERFVSVLRGGSLPEEKNPFGYQLRQLFYPLLMLFTIMVIAFVVKYGLPIHNPSTSSSPDHSALSQSASGRPTAAPAQSDGEEMSYEDAKKVFGDIE